MCNIVSDGIGWIGMVLVDESHRRKGIATRLMRHVIAEMDRTGIPTARLDATPMGKSLYERLGFSVDYDLVRYEGKPSPHGVLGDAVRPAEESDYEEILALDARVKNINRRRVLTRFFHECPDHLWVYREGPQTSGSPISGSPISGYPISGYIAAREGTRAWQIGPCMALHPDAGRALLATVFQSLSRRKGFCRRFGGKSIGGRLRPRRRPGTAASTDEDVAWPGTGRRPDENLVQLGAGKGVARRFMETVGSREW